ncbi:hypothetical protein T4C_5696, partial [Trichinella pseudospiralis]
RTFDDATTCQVSQTNKCPITDDKAPLWRSLFAYWSARSSEDLLLIGHFIFDDQISFSMNLHSNVCSINFITGHARTI